MVLLISAIGILLFAATGANVESSMHACSLLTADEVGTALGDKASPPHENNVIIDKGPSKGETMRTCTWRVGGQGMVSLNVIRAPKDAKPGTALLHQAFETLKSQGWKEERKQLGSVTCVLMTPPSGQDKLPISTGCLGEAKERGLSIGAMGKKAVPIEQIKPLFDKAVARLQ